MVSPLSVRDPPENLASSRATSGESVVSPPYPNELLPRTWDAYFAMIRAASGSSTDTDELSPELNESLLLSP